MSVEQRRIDSLENKIAYWESNLQDRRSRVNAWADKHTGEGASDSKKEYWEARRTASLESIDLIERQRLEPLRQEYRKLLGIDD